jgi:hypothetical protein
MVIVHEHLLDVLDCAKHVPVFSGTCRGLPRGFPNCADMAVTGHEAGEGTHHRLLYPDNIMIYGCD